MKKKFVIALMSFVMIPCLLLLTACKQTISASDYQENVYNSAVKYYKTYGSTDMKLVYTTEEDSSYDQELTRTLGTDTIKEKFTITYKTEKTQTIEFENGSLRITTVEKNTENGTEVKEDNSAFEAYTETIETTTVVTMVDDNTTHKAYKTVEVKENGEVVDTESVKEVYTYDSGESYTHDLKELLYNIDENLVSNYFQQESVLIFNLYGSSETYKNGREFGLNGALMMGGSFNDSSDYEDYGADLMKLNVEINFKDGAPNFCRIENSNESTGRNGIENIKSSSVSELKCFDEATVTAPTGFTETDAVGSPITLPTIENFSIGMGL